MVTLRTSDPLDGARPFTSDLFFFNLSALHNCTRVPNKIFTLAFIDAGLCISCDFLHLSCFH